MLHMLWRLYSSKQLHVFFQMMHATTYSLHILAMPATHMFFCPMHAMTYFCYILAPCLPHSFFCLLPWFRGVQDFLCQVTRCQTHCVSVPHSAPPHLLNAHLHSQTYIYTLLMPHFIIWGCLSLCLLRHQASLDSLYLGFTAHLRGLDTFSHSRLGSLFRSINILGFFPKHVQQFVAFLTYIHFNQ